MIDYTTNPAQSALTAKVNAAWAETEAYFSQVDNPGTAAIPDPHPRLATEFFALYLAHRPGQIAEQAASYAGIMWSQYDGGSYQIEAALTQIGDDSNAIEATLGSVWNALQRDGRSAEADDLIDSLLNRIELVEQRSQALLSLVWSWMYSGDHARARAACERIIQWNAMPQFVEQARDCVHEMDNLNIGQMAPLFQTRDIDDNPLDFAALRGKTVLIDFWATWCAPCRGEFPHLRRVHERFAGHGFILLSISLDDDCDAARKMIAQESLAWLHVCEGAYVSPIAKLFNVRGIPRTYLINPEGRIVGKSLRDHELDPAISRLVER